MVAATLLVMDRALESSPITFHDILVISADDVMHAWLKMVELSWVIIILQTREQKLRRGQWRGKLMGIQSKCIRNNAGTRHWWRLRATKRTPNQLEANKYPLVWWFYALQWFMKAHLSILRRLMTTSPSYPSPWKQYVASPLRDRLLQPPTKLGARQDRTCGWIERVDPWQTAQMM